MAAATFVKYAVSSTYGTSPRSVGLASGWTVNDVIIAFVMCSKTSGFTTTPVITPPAGWNLITSVQSANHDLLASYYKVSAGGAEGTQSWSATNTTQMGVVCSGWSGVNTTVIADQFANSVDNTGGTNINAVTSSVTTRGDGEQVLLGFGSTNNASATTFGDIAGWLTNRSTLTASVQSTTGSIAGFDKAFPVSQSAVGAQTSATTGVTTKILTLTVSLFPLDDALGTKNNGTQLNNLIGQASHTASGLLADLSSQNVAGQGNETATLTQLQALGSNNLKGQASFTGTLQFLFGLQSILGQASFTALLTQLQALGANNLKGQASLAATLQFLLGNQSLQAQASFIASALDVQFLFSNQSVIGQGSLNQAALQFLLGNQTLQGQASLSSTLQFLLGSQSVNGQGSLNPALLQFLLGLQNMSGRGILNTPALIQLQDLGLQAAKGQSSFTISALIALLGAVNAVGQGSSTMNSATISFALSESASIKELG